MIKDHISATKGSITSKNFEILLRNLTRSQKPSYWRFLENFKCLADMKVEASFYENIDQLETQICPEQREANTRFHSWSYASGHIDGRQTSTWHIVSLRKPNLFLSFLILVHVCFTFRTMIEFRIFKMFSANLLRLHVSLQKKQRRNLR